MYPRNLEDVGTTKDKHAVGQLVKVMEDRSVGKNEEGGQGEILSSEYSKDLSCWCYEVKMVMDNRVIKSAPDHQLVRMEKLPDSMTTRSGSNLGDDKGYKL